VAKLIGEKEIERVVIGESRNFRGEPNAIMEDIEQFKKDLEELCGVEVIYEQEFLTSAQAAREGESKDIDAASAALILQSYLDRADNKR
jgi:putative Holliday junction resolvase